MNFGIRNDRTSFAYTTGCIFNDHRNDGLGTRCDRNCIVRNVNIRIGFERCRERKAVDFGLLANRCELAQVKRVFCIARACIQHHEHERAIFANGSKRVAVVAIDKTRTRSNSTAKRSMHIESRRIRECLLFMVNSNGAPIFSRVRKLPIDPSARMHIAEVMQNHIRHPKRNIETSTAVERSRFGLPNALVGGKSCIVKLGSRIVTGIAMRIHLEHIGTSFGTVAIETRQSIANVRFIGSTHRSCREQTFRFESLAKLHNHF